MIHTFSEIRPAQITDGLSTTMVIGDRHIPPAIAGAGVMEHYNQGDTAIFVSDTPTHTVPRHRSWLGFKSP